nr:hypothetical protein [Tanacetum cinerariifolium]
GLNLEQEHVKKQKSSDEAPEMEEPTEEITEEKIKELMQLVPQLDREDLNQLWDLVKEYLSIRPATSDKEMELWVKLKRMYEPDLEDQLWTLTQNFMHAPVEWKLYDLSGVHHLTAKVKEIFMLVEKDYPLRRSLALVMISYKLQFSTSGINDSEEIARVLTSIDAATVLAGEIDVPTGSGSIPTAGPLATVISTGSEVGPTTSPIAIRRKGKEVIVESDTPKKKKLQEQIDA